MEGWKEIVFPEFIALQRGKDLTKTSFRSGSIPVAGSNGIIGFHNIAIVKAPGVTIGRSGTCGKANFYKQDFWAHNTALYVKDFKGNDALFTYFFLVYFNAGRFKTGVSVPTLDRNSLNNVTVRIPPLPEQRKIAYILSTIQKAIEQQDKLIKTTIELKKALMQKLFTEGLYGEPQKETEIGLVPESWEVVELGDICERISISIQPNPNGDKLYVGLEHIIPGQIYLTDFGRESEVVSSKAAFKKGEILYGKLRPYLDKAVIAHFDGISSTDILIFTGKNDVENDFLIHFFHTEMLIDFAKSTTTGVQHPRTSWSSLKKLKLGLPSKAERRFIAKSLNLFENKLLFHQKKKQSLTALFKTLLHELMTGQRRVHKIDFWGLSEAESPDKEYRIEEQPLSVAAEK
ncbi:MAG: restriction endonuclease subunit S [Bacteroidales bacterium]|nr:restriction endonuclease subunit S [Bacteroidales bacterium]